MNASPLFFCTDDLLDGYSWPWNWNDTKSPPAAGCLAVGAFPFPLPKRRVTATGPTETWLGDGEDRRLSAHAAKGHARVNLWQGDAIAAYGFGRTIEEACADAMNDLMRRMTETGS